MVLSLAKLFRSVDFVQAAQSTSNFSTDFEYFYHRIWRRSFESLVALVHKIARTNVFWLFVCCFFSLNLFLFICVVFLDSFVSFVTKACMDQWIKRKMHVNNPIIANISMWVCGMCFWMSCCHYEFVYSRFDCASKSRLLVCENSDFFFRVNGGFCIRPHMETIKQNKTKQIVNVHSSKIIDHLTFGRTVNKTNCLLFDSTFIHTFGVTIFKSSRRNESRIFSCSTVRMTLVIVAAVDGTKDDGDHTLPDSIFSSVGTIRLLQSIKSTHTHTHKNG